MKFFLVFFVWLSLSLSVFAQTHNGFWSRLYVAEKLNNKLSIAADVQYRQQSNWYVKNVSIMEFANLRSIRLWINYKIKNNYELLSAPIAYFKNYEIISKDATLKQTNELRTTIGLSKLFELKNIKQKNKLFYEFRYLNFNNSNAFFQHRIRLQNSIILPLAKLNSKIQLNDVVQNDFFIKSQSSKLVFDQNRIQNSLQLQLHNIDFSIGYQFIIQNSSRLIVLKNQVLFTTNIEL